MLDDAKVLRFIKQNLGFPFMTLEWTDEQILEYVKDNTIRDWSYYSPDVQKMALNVRAESNKVPGRSNEFFINEPEGREILNIVEIYPDVSAYYINGHPPFGVFTEFELREWSLAVSQAMTTKMFSSFDMTYEFKHPNIVRISPVPSTSNTGFLTVEYERMSCEDFSEIPNDVQRLFLDLSLADVMIALGRIRKRYENVQTPFGQVPLSSDIFDEGKTLRTEVIEKLERLYIPNIRIEHG